MYGGHLSKKSQGDRRTEQSLKLSTIDMSTKFSHGLGPTSILKSVIVLFCAKLIVNATILQISVISCKKADLERKLDSLIAEKEGLSLNLEDSSEKILILEKQNREQELQIATCLHEINEIRATNQTLAAR